MGTLRKLVSHMALVIVAYLVTTYAFAAYELEPWHESAHNVFGGWAAWLKLGSFWPALGLYVDWTSHDVNRPSRTAVLGQGVLFLGCVVILSALLLRLKRARATRRSIPTR